MYLFRLIILTIVLLIIAFICGNIFDIRFLDIIILASIIAPWGVLGRIEYEKKVDFNISPNFFQNLTSIFFSILFIFGVYLYGKQNSFIEMVIYLIIAAITQSSYYTFIKYTIKLPEKIIFLLMVVGFILYFTIVV